MRGILRPTTFIFPAALLFLAGGFNGPSSAGAAEGFPILKGEYLGQQLPGTEPELFAPGIISTGMFTRDIAMTPDGREIYFTAVLGRYRITQILFTRWIGGTWTEPEIAPFSGNPDYMDAEPFVTPDGRRLLFLSTRPDSAGGVPEGDQEIWVVDRSGEGWSEPYNLGAPVNTRNAEFFPSVTNDGTIYFTRSEGRNSYIFRSRMVDGKLSEPVKLPSQVNSTGIQYNAFISPDESYLIFASAGREDCLGGDDYYVCFKDSGDSWTEPINLGARVNTTDGSEHSPYVSPDGKFFFFMSARIGDKFDQGNGKLTRDMMLKMHNEPAGGLPGIYWMEASFIEGLKP